MNTNNPQPRATRAPQTLADLGRGVRAAFGREPGLTLLGVIGLVVSVLCLVAVAVRGSFIPPEGKMLDAATFTFGVAIFTLTMALILPLAGFSAKARRRWRRLSYIFVIYGFILEPLQSFRGLDPRFTDAGGTVDVIAGILFGVTALLQTILFIVLAWRCFRPEVLTNRPILRIGIRYGVVGVAISFAIGILMSILSGRRIGTEGNLLLAHALGVHAIQALPVVALLVVWGVTRRPTPILIHVAGVGWLAAVVATFLQALLDQRFLTASPLTALTLTGLAVWAVIGAYALIASLRRLYAGAVAPIE